MKRMFLRKIIIWNSNFLIDYSYSYSDFDFLNIIICSKKYFILKLYQGEYPFFLCLYAISNL